MNQRDWNVTDDPEVNVGPRYRAEEPESWLQRHKGIARSIGCAFLVSVIMHLPYIKVAVVWACGLVVMIFGKPEKIKDIEEAMDRMGGKVRQAAKDAESPGSKFNTILTPLKAGSVVERIAEKAVAPAKAVVGNVVEKVETAKEKGVEVVADVKETAVKTGDKVVNAVQNLGGDPKPQNKGFGSGLMAMMRPDPVAREKAARDQLEYRAAKLHLKVEKEWSTPELQARVEEAQLRWNVSHGPNAMCPMCKAPMRVSVKGTGQTVRCPVCPAIFPARRARDLYQTKVLALQLKR